MALDLWFREDVARLLSMAQESMKRPMGTILPLDPKVAAAYQAGFMDALRSVAIGFGLTENYQIEIIDIPRPNKEGPRRFPVLFVDQPSTIQR